MSRIPHCLDDRLTGSSGFLSLEKHPFFVLNTAGYFVNLTIMFKPRNVLILGAHGSIVIKALCCKPEGRQRSFWSH
jgi:hypothetical protein